MVLSSSFDPVVTELKKEFDDNLVAVALFGSVARGEAKPRSDLDFLVILTDKTRDRDRLCRVYQCIHRIVTADGVSRDVTVLESDEDFIVSNDTEVTPLILNIAADAIILHDPKHKLSSFIDKVKKIIDLAGLERYKVETGEYGWKPKDGVLHEVEV